MPKEQHSKIELSMEYLPSLLLYMISTNQVFPHIISSLYVNLYNNICSISNFEFHLSNPTQNIFSEGINVCCRTSENLKLKKQYQRLHQSPTCRWLCWGLLCLCSVSTELWENLAHKVILLLVQLRIILPSFCQFLLTTHICHFAKYQLQHMLHPWLFTISSWARHVAGMGEEESI